MLLKYTLGINNDFARQQEMAMTNVSIEENVVIHTVAGHTKGQHLLLEFRCLTKEG